MRQRTKPRPFMIVTLLAVASCTMTRAWPMQALYPADSPKPVEGPSISLSIATTLDTLTLAHELVDSYATLAQAVSGEMVIEAPVAIAETVRTSRADLGLLVMPASPRGAPSPPGEWADLDPLLIGWDAVVVVVHALRQAGGWDRSIATAILAGDLHDWSEIGSGSGTIALLGRAAGASTREALVTYLGTFDVSPRLELLPSDAAICSEIAKRPLSLGWVALSSVNDRCRPVALEGVLPTARTVRNGTYEPRLAILLVTAPDASPEAKDLARWATTPQGQRVIARRHVPAH